MKQLKAAPAGFVNVTLPNGLSYNLSIDVLDPDSYHVTVATGSAYDPSWYFLQTWTRPGDVLFDLGANIGTISIPAAVSGAEVHSFELLDANIQHLIKSIHENDLTNISIVLGAVSNTNRLMGVTGHSAWGFVTAGRPLLYIPGLIIDDYVRQRDITVVHTMKIDIEGSEKAALEGAAALIDRDHPDILVECNAFSCGLSNYSYRDVLQFLETKSYTLYRVHERRLIRWKSSDVQEVIFTDYLATTKSESEVVTRSGWEIETMTDDEIIQSILDQEKFGGLHVEFVLAIATTLSASIQSNQRIASALARWRATSALTSLELLALGAA